MMNSGLDTSLKISGTSLDDLGIKERDKPHYIGDICYWDGTELAYTAYTSWSSSLGTALAVCVIPTSHAKVWGDGKARFVSAKGVTSDGDASTSNVSIEWGTSGIDTKLTNYTKVPTWDNTIGGSKGTNDYGYISSDRFTGGTQNVIDSGSKYKITSNMIPSPYAADGSFYSDYARTISGNNALSDFNGKANTAVLYALGTDYKAARGCYLYSTSGITQGNWYLPAMGELAYIMPRFNVIQAALSACGGVLLDTGYSYWSSTEFSSLYACRVSTHNGYVLDYSKDLELYVRPFVALS